MAKCVDARQRRNFSVYADSASLLPESPCRASYPRSMVVASGWLGVLFGYFEWIANPLIFYSWISARRKRILPALLASIAAGGLILSFLLRKKMDWPGMATDTRPDIHRDEGSPAPVRRVLRAPRRN
jgi:hypothetical protein